MLGTDWQRVTAEARIRGQVHAQGDSGLGFLSDRFTPFVKGTDIPARTSFLGFRYETDAAGFGESDQMANPRREVSVEVLRDDPRCLYLEIMSINE